MLFVLFYVLFVCKCVLYYCYRGSTQLQLINASYHIIYLIVSYHVSYHIVSYCIVSYHIIYIIYRIISYHISYHVFHNSLFHFVVGLQTDPSPLPKRVLHTVRPSASSFNLRCLVFSRSSVAVYVFFLVFLSLLSFLLSFLH